jgi:flagellar protein FlgJ
MDIAKISNMPIENSISTANTTKNTVEDTSFEENLKSAMERKDEKALKEACTQFEGILLQMMYKQMKATVPKGTLIPKSYGTEYFEGMLDEALVDNAAKTNSIGLADMLYKQLSKQMKYDNTTQNK